MGSSGPFGDEVAQRLAVVERVLERLVCISGSRAFPAFLEFWT